MSTMTITRNGSDYEVELEGLCLLPAEPEVGVAAQYEQVMAWNDELGHVDLTPSEYEQALQRVNDDMHEEGTRLTPPMRIFRGI